MSKVIFNDKQIKLLAKNPNVLRVSDKAITYSEEFKNRFIEENSKGVLGLKDSRTSNSGRPLLRELTAQEEIERLKSKISLLEIENEFLKKLDEIERK